VADSRTFAPRFDDAAGTVEEICSQLLLSSVSELNGLYYSAC